MPTAMAAASVPAMATVMPAAMTMMPTMPMVTGAMAMMQDATMSPFAIRIGDHFIYAAEFIDVWVAYPSILLLRFP